MTGVEPSSVDDSKYGHSLGGFVRDHEREIVATWIDRVRQTPSARIVPDSALIARVSPILRWLAEQQDPVRRVEPLERVADELAAARIADGTAERDVVAEWSALRDCLLRPWTATLELGELFAATTFVNRILDTCVVAAVDRFARAHHRTLDAVENVSTATFESATLGELLQRLLRTFKRAAPSVDVAVIALAEDEVLRIQAAVGLDVRDQAVVRIGDGFLGRIAAEKRALSLRHGAMAPLVLHPGVTGSEMCAAYGVPLIEDGCVFGVAVIGSRTSWEFSHSDRVVFDVIARRAAAAISYWKVREVFDREKAQLGVLLSQLPAGVIVAEAPSGRMTLHSTQVERMWRRSFIRSESVEQYRVWPGYHANGQRMTADEWPLARAIQRGETTLNEEVEILRGDGSRGAILISAAPIRAEDGRIVGGVATLTDITERRAVEEQLKLAMEQAHRAATFQEVVAEASQRLAEAFEMEPTVVSIARLGLPKVADSCAVYELGEDDQLRIVELANVDPAKTARLHERLSRLPMIVPGVFLREVIEERKPRILPVVTEELLREAQVDPLQLDVIREYGIVSLMLLPLIARGRTLGVLAYANGESGRRFSPGDLELAHELARRASLALDNAHMYDAARRSASELSGLISIAADAIITVDDDQRVCIYNEGAERMFGWTREEVLGRSLDMLLPERLRAAHRRYLQEFMVGTATARRMGERNSVCALRKDGVEFPAEAAISKLDIDGKHLLTVVMRDITERLRLEREREAAISMRDEVMGVVAHDLRNPLGTILMLASTLQKRATDESSQRSAEALERAANRMNRLIQDLLDVTRIEAGHLAIETSRVSTRQLVLDCADAQRAQLASTSLAIEVQLAPELPDVRADPHRLLEVLENLIGNAIKFSRDGGRIIIGARPSDRDVLFWIADQGIGIAPEHASRVFDRFWQVQNGRRQGAGLGLSIVKGLVEAHGGRIWLESTPGRGTTFFFTIPAVSRAEASADRSPR